jgi:hypothetical protein
MVLFWEALCSQHLNFESRNVAFPPRNAVTSQELDRMMSVVCLACSTCSPTSFRSKLAATNLTPSMFSLFSLFSNPDTHKGVARQYHALCIEARSTRNAPGVLYEFGVLSAHHLMVIMSCIRTPIPTTT